MLQVVLPQGVMLHRVCVNPDHCSVFISELIAISGALDHALNFCKDSIWILIESSSSIQYLKNWPKIMDSTDVDILSKLSKLGQRKQVCLQWIPSHVDVPGNEEANELVGSGCDLSNPSSLSTVLNYSEIPSFQRNKIYWTCKIFLLTTGTQLRVLAYLYSAGVPGLIRRPWRALEAVACVV
ncbi:RNase H domain-containing protein [Trichonephila clavipes]|nr:RNase H domain-containing protein [Trichonephila clavipes]